MGDSKKKKTKMRKESCKLSRLFTPSPLFNQLDLVAADDPDSDADNPYLTIPDSLISANNTRLELAISDQLPPTPTPLPLLLLPPPSPSPTPLPSDLSPLKFPPLPSNKSQPTSSADLSSGAPPVSAGLKPADLPPKPTIQDPLPSHPIHPTSFASTVRSRKPGPKPIPLSFVPGIKQGIIESTNEDIADQVAKWNLTLVGAPVGENISFKFMEKFIATHWNNIMLPRILRKDNGLFVFHFDKEEDLITILERAPWTIRNKPLVLRRWKEGMPLDISCLDNIPIWVTISELDVRFWSEYMLERIGSAIGIPILTDYHSATQGRLSFARVLVEIAPDSVLLDEITFKGPKDELISQPFTYNWLPPICKKNALSLGTAALLKVTSKPDPHPTILIQYLLLKLPCPHFSQLHRALKKFPPLPKRTLLLQLPTHLLLTSTITHIL
ncbi:hypothetical protein V2J09_018862 [Rumex salicifolius]